MSQRAGRAIDAANAANTAHDYDYLTSEVDVNDEIPEARPHTHRTRKHRTRTRARAALLHFAVRCCNQLGVAG